MNENQTALIEFVKSKEKVSLKECYAQFPTWSRDGMRGFINASNKAGLYFMRVGEGLYTYKP